MPANTLLSFSAHTSAQDIAQQLFDAVGPKQATMIGAALDGMRERAIVEAYSNNRHSAAHIAEDFNTTRMTIYRILKRRGIPVRSESA